MNELEKAIADLKRRSRENFDEATENLKNGNQAQGAYLDGMSDGIDYALEQLEELIDELIDSVDVNKGGWSHL